MSQMPRFVLTQDAENVAPAGASTQSTAAPTNARWARITATAEMRYRKGSNPTALATDQLLPLGVVEFVPIEEGLKFAFLGTGTVSVAFGDFA